VFTKKAAASCEAAAFGILAAAGTYRHAPVRTINIYKKKKKEFNSNQRQSKVNKK